MKLREMPLENSIAIRVYAPYSANCRFQVQFGSFPLGAEITLVRARWRRLVAHLTKAPWPARLQSRVPIIDLATGRVSWGGVQGNKRDFRLPGTMFDGAVAFSIHRPFYRELRHSILGAEKLYRSRKARKIEGLDCIDLYAGGRRYTGTFLRPAVTNLDPRFRTIILH